MALDVVENKEDKEKIEHLFFHRVWSIEEIEKIGMKNKYSYNAIKKVIKNKYDNWSKKNEDLCR